MENIQETLNQVFPNWGPRTTEWSMAAAQGVREDITKKIWNM